MKNSNYAKVGKVSIHQLVGHKVMVFDTETTDLPQFTKDSTIKYYDFRENQAYDQSRILSIAWSYWPQFDLTDKPETHYHVRKPIDFNRCIFHPKAIEKNGLTFEKTSKEGIKFEEIMAKFLPYLNTVEYVIGCNVLFDLHILLNELYRMGKLPIGDIKYVNVQGINDRSGKVLRLDQWYHNLYKQEPKSSHSSQSDVDTLFRCMGKTNVDAKCHNVYTISTSNDVTLKQHVSSVSGTTSAPITPTQTLSPASSSKSEPVVSKIKIKGIIYFISKQPDSNQEYTLYECNDGSIGVVVGRKTKQNQYILIPTTSTEIHSVPKGGIIYSICGEIKTECETNADGICVTCSADLDDDYEIEQIKQEIIEHGITCETQIGYVVPSITQDPTWIKCFSPVQPAHVDTKLVGKWVIINNWDEIDSLWENICRCTLENKLGYETHVSTRKHQRESTGIIFVFTTNYNDLDEVKRVLGEIRKLGIYKELRYSKLGWSDKLYSSNDKIMCTN